MESGDAVDFPTGAVQWFGGKNASEECEPMFQWVWPEIGAIQAKQIEGVEFPTQIFASQQGIAEVFSGSKNLAGFEAAIEFFFDPILRVVSPRESDSERDDDFAGF